ncbi:unnamed protein product [Thlaspi arvense]|uniref:Uncharacterized protein n=1 Tax=Thlaspi arvense TaxID=13288 RepID=A0AAU9RV91_THLAR|nr:unnamed protein product [Thlaspi arvense]
MYPNPADMYLLHKLLHAIQTRVTADKVHGAFAGYSGITVGICNTHYVYLPIPEVISYSRAVDPNSRMWHRCLTSTGQPDFI